MVGSPRDRARGTTCTNNERRVLLKVARKIPALFYFRKTITTQQVESKYGESVSVKDITGRNPVKKGRGNPAAGDGPAADTTPTASTSAENDAALPGVAGGDGEGNLSMGKQAPARRKAPTDSTNLAFEEWLRGRRPRDFLAEQVIRPVTGN